MARHPTFALVRPDDLLVIDVVTEGLDVRPVGTGRRGPAGFELQVPPGGAGRLTLRLPPQELAEGPADSGRSVVTEPSEAVFAVTSDDPPIPTGTDGILDAARRLPRLDEDRPPTGAGNPLELGTRFDRPYVLRLRLPAWSLRVVQDGEPTGLWQAGVGARTVRFDVLDYRTASGPWSSGRSTGARRGATRLPSSKNPVVVRARVRMA